MQLETVRFGQVDIDESKILVFGDGLPGLEEYSKFAIIKLDESYPIVWLQSVEEMEICLPVIDSFVVLPDYSFDIGDEDVGELELTNPEELHVLSVLVVPESIEGMTANLAAPIVINKATNKAKQIILSGGEYNVRYPVFANILKLIKEEGADAGTVKEDK
ncbi:MAG: flagellar assembly protein FliW [Oscillospiraceae bacterium]|jgi:flagellar assembly factor FliW|nr:flagellar assembly protein FliW [Oscillospiraceae bacterium]